MVEGERKTRGTAKDVFTVKQEFLWVISLMFMGRVEIKHRELKKSRNIGEVVPDADSHLNYAKTT